MLRVDRVTVAYGGITALREVTINVPEGRIVAIIGANGAGKSTLLKTVSGMVARNNGSVRFRGATIDGLAPDRIMRRGICHVPEGRQLFTTLRVRDNLDLGAYHYYSRRHRREIERCRQTVFELFPILNQRASQIAGTLSGGEQQMLAIGRAMMGRPVLMLLDEPSMGIAPLVVRELFRVIRRLNEQGTTVLLVEQNAREALKVAHYGYILERGQVAMEGLAVELLHTPQVKEAYLGG